MKLALECPTYMLGKVQPLADFDFILTHLVLQDEEYAAFYSKSTRWKVLDNSCNELLRPCTLDDIKKASNKVEPDLIVAPDFLGDEEATRHSLTAAMSTFGMKSVLPVVQGDKLSSAVKCARHILGLGFWRLAVPYDITCSRASTLEVMADRRHRVILAILAIAPKDFQIHLLGMTTLRELAYYHGGHVASIDTGGPIANGMFGRLFGRDELLTKGIPTMEVMGEDVEFALEDVYYNVAYLRKILNGA